jgi:UDPglucose 6-dehydrogenase
MKLGFIGLGIVGNAMRDVFSEKHETFFYDPKVSESMFIDILETEIVFIAVPTNSGPSGDCDVSIVVSVIEQLHTYEYKGIICIKSTVIPETTLGFIKKYNNPRICFSPEFLKARSAYKDFKESPFCIVGTISDEVFQRMSLLHKVCKRLDPTAAEMAKYFQNVYNTNKILFANAFYEVCKKKGVDYDQMVESLSIDTSYLKCSEELRGPAGACLPKDTRAFNEYVKKEIDSSLFQALVNDMDLYPKTIKMDVKYYCITLPHRSPIVSKIAEKLPITVIDAVNGSLFTKDLVDTLVLNKFIEPPFLDKYIVGRKISVGQVGCFMSHQKALSLVLDQSESYAVILEDDIEISDHFIENVTELIANFKHDYDLIRLHTVSVQRPLLPPELKGLIPVPKECWGTLAYLVKKTSVTKILNALFPMQSTIDIQLSYSNLSQFVTVDIPFIKELDTPSFLNTKGTKYISDFYELAATESQSAPPPQEFQ